MTTGTSTSPANTRRLVALPAVAVRRSEASSPRPFPIKTGADIELAVLPPGIMSFPASPRAAKNRAATPIKKRKRPPPHVITTAAVSPSGSPKKTTSLCLSPAERPPLSPDRSRRRRGGEGSTRSKQQAVLLAAKSCSPRRPQQQRQQQHDDDVFLFDLQAPWTDANLCSPPSYPAVPDLFLPTTASEQSQPVAESGVVAPRLSPSFRSVEDRRRPMHRATGGGLLHMLASSPPAVMMIEGMGEQIISDDDEDEGMEEDDEDEGEGEDDEDLVGLKFVSFDDEGEEEEIIG